MFPLSHAMWLGMNVTIPHAAHAISRIVYGPGYVDTVRYRADCLHNTFHGRLWY